MIDPLYVTGGAILAGLVLYRFRDRVIGAFRRFDATNRARIEEQERERFDGLAHFRHTLARAEEQVEQIGELTLSDERTATPVTRFVFEGEHFATRGEAERARAEKVRALARAFYVELPRALSERKGNGKLR